MIPVSVIIPVKNEAGNLLACLMTLSGIAEVIVVDSDSTDDTVEIATAHGAKVVNFRWRGGYPKKRNWVLETHSFTTDWVLFLDADEHLTDEFKSELAMAISRSGVDGYWINYRNNFMGRLLQHGVPQRKLALFRIGAGIYERVADDGWSTLDMEVHEHPVIAGTVSEMRAPIDHFGYRGVHHFLARHNEYSTWEARRYLEVRQSGDSVQRELTPRQRRKYRYAESMWFGLAYFLTAYILRGGFLDGRAGLHYAILKGIYFYSVSLKIKEVRRQEPQSRNGGDKPA